MEAARLLKPLLGELVFVGGSTTALLITDKAAADVRPTYDVDAIAEIGSYAEYADFSERLRKCGFTEDAGEGAPICRWRQKKTILDVMPLDEKILGFSNRWYKPAMDTSVPAKCSPFAKIFFMASMRLRPTAVSCAVTGVSWATVERRALRTATIVLRPVEVSR
jgi:hypothetical protein